MATNQTRATRERCLREYIRPASPPGFPQGEIQTTERSLLLDYLQWDRLFRYGRQQGSFTSSAGTVQPGIGTSTVRIQQAQDIVRCPPISVAGCHPPRLQFTPGYIPASVLQFKLNSGPNFHPAGIPSSEGWITSSSYRLFPEMRSRTRKQESDRMHTMAIKRRPQILRFSFFNFSSSYS